MTDPLTVAVHRLTRETRTKVIQDGKQPAIVIHEALLSRLANAVTSSLGAPTSGRGSDLGASSPLNSDALYRSGIIRAAIQSWCRMVGAEVTRVMTVDLEAWAEKFKGDSTSHERHLADWKKEIENLLDPPTPVQVLGPCPACGAEGWTNAEGHVMRHPVVIHVQIEDAEHLENATGMCRACAKVWTGEREIRGMRWELEAS